MVDTVSYISTTDFLLEVSKGDVPGHTSVNKFGRNPDIDSGATPEDIWDGGGTWVAPTAARIHDLVSDSAADTSAGTGARTVRVSGLVDWNTAETEEVVTLNGTTNVATANAYVIIHRMRVLTVGSGGINAGNITATAQTDGTVTAQIIPNFGQTLMAIYGWPSTQVFYAYNYYGVWNRSGGSQNEASLFPYVKIPADQTDTPFVVGHIVGLFGAGSTYVPVPFRPPVRLEGPGIIKIRSGEVSANNTSIAAGFDGVLVDNNAS